MAKNLSNQREPNPLFELFPNSFQATHCCSQCKLSKNIWQLKYEYTSKETSAPTGYGLCRKCYFNRYNAFNQSHTQTRAYFDQKDYHLVKVHYLSKEWIRYWNMVIKITHNIEPKFYVKQNGFYDFLYYTYKNDEGELIYADKSTPIPEGKNLIFHTLEMPPPPKKKCNCCH